MSALFFERLFSKVTVYWSLRLSRKVMCFHETMENAIDASISKQEASVSVKWKRKKGFIAQKPGKCTNHGKGCRSKTNGVAPVFKQQKNGSWQVTCLACQAYKRENCRKRKLKRQAKMEVEEEVSSGAIDGTPTHCSNEIYGRCISKKQGLLPEFQRMRNGKWYKTCDRCQVVHREVTKSIKKLHSMDAQNQGKHYCDRCNRYLDNCAFDKNENGKNKHNCIKCCEERLRNVNFSTSPRIQDVFSREQRGKCTVLMTYEELERIVRLACLYCGAINFGMSGFDRIDSHIREYRKDNVVPCCGRCNRTKGVLSVDVFIKRMYHFVFHHCHSITVPGKEFREAFENPNTERRTYTAITQDAKRDGYEFHFTREQYEKTLDDQLCDICKINPSTSIIRYRRDRDLSPDNFSRVCKCCGPMFPNVSPCELPTLAKTIVLHSETIGLLNKIESGDPIFVFEEDTICSNEE